MKKIYLTIFSLSFALVGIAGNENFPVGARSASMGNASVSLIDLWSVQHNQGSLGFLRNASAGVYYENRYSLKELSLKGGAVVLPIKGGTFGLCISNFGYSQYNESKYSLSFGKTLSEKLSIGVAMDYLSTKIGEGYGSKGVIAAEVGILAKPMKGLTIGAHIFNPTKTKLADYNNERVPTIIRLGANYRFSDKVLVAVETEKDLSLQPIFKAGIEYKAVREFYLRAGIGSNPTLSSFGFGLNFKSVKIDISGSYHQVLGFYPQFGLMYTFDKKEESPPKIL